MNALPTTADIVIIGPNGAGKTTLANRIARDWTGDAVGPVSEIPHETRRSRKKEDIIISGANGATITIDIVDTPGHADFAGEVERPVVKKSLS
jgi:GTPase SAR1 family protein